MVYEIQTKIEVDPTDVLPFNVSWNVRFKDSLFNKRIENHIQSQKLCIFIRDNLVIKMGFKPVKVLIKVPRNLDISKDMFNDIYGFETEIKAKAFENEYKIAITNFLNKQLEAYTELLNKK